MKDVRVHYVDYDIYEPYVLYKIRPLLRDKKYDILKNAKNAKNDTQAAKVLDLISSFAADCSMDSALRLGKTVKDTFACEDSDVVYADAYISSAIMVLTKLKCAPKIRSNVCNKFTSRIASDTAYLILDDEAIVKNTAQEGWKCSNGYDLKGPTPQSNRELIKRLLKISALRMKGVVRPYIHIDRDVADLSTYLELYREISTGKECGSLDVWYETLCQAREAMEKSGLNVLDGDTIPPYIHSPVAQVS